MQPSSPSLTPLKIAAPNTEYNLKALDEQIASAELNITSLRLIPAGDITLKQKLQLKRAEDHLAGLYKAREVC
jgi:hypothetical protein